MALQALDLAKCLQYIHSGKPFIG